MPAPGTSLNGGLSLSGLLSRHACSSSFVGHFLCFRPHMMVCTQAASPCISHAACSALVCSCQSMHSAGPTHAHDICCGFALAAQPALRDRACLAAGVCGSLRFACRARFMIEAAAQRHPKLLCDTPPAQNSQSGTPLKTAKLPAGTPQHNLCPRLHRSGPAPPRGAPPHPCSGCCHGPGGRAGCLRPAADGL